MKIMLTGGRGMLGRTLVRELSEYEVVATDLPEVDITDPAGIDRALRENLAGEDSPPQQIHEILRYINAHFTQPLSLDDIAERFFLSKFYLLRQFKNYTNCTIHDHLSGINDC